MSAHDQFFHFAVVVVVVVVVLLLHVQGRTIEKESSGNCVFAAKVTLFV